MLVEKNGIGPLGHDVAEDQDADEECRDEYQKVSQRRPRTSVHFYLRIQSVPLCQCSHLVLPVVIVKADRYSA